MLKTALGYILDRLAIAALLLLALKLASLSLDRIDSPLRGIFPLSKPFEQIIQALK